MHMADMESICARRCLLTRAAWKENLPAPLSRRAVHNLLRFGALEGLTLRKTARVRRDAYERAEKLLCRSAQVCDAVVHIADQGFSVMLPEDDEWPHMLALLKEDMPQFLFARGRKELLRQKTISVAGSRRIQEDTARIAQKIGEQIASEGFVMVSGGAQGVDTSAQKACLENGGSLILVPAYPCSELLEHEYLRRAFDDGRLLFLCDTWPDEPFSAHKALARNHTIYALVCASVVIAARKGIGGSWRGAVDSIQKGYSPVFAADLQGEDFSGNSALIELGAKPFDIVSALQPQLFGKEM